MRRIPSSHMQQLCGNEEAVGEELRFTSRQQRAYLCCTLAVWGVRQKWKEKLTEKEEEKRKGKRSPRGEIENRIRKGNVSL